MPAFVVYFALVQMPIRWRCPGADAVCEAIFLPPHRQQVANTTLGKIGGVLSSASLASQISPLAVGNGSSLELINFRAQSVLCNTLEGFWQKEVAV